MPLRVNYSGVMPLIFAQAILMFPGMVLRSLGSIEGWEEIFLTAATWFEAGHWFYYVTYALMIMFFAYFWVATTFNEIEIADNLKKNGATFRACDPARRPVTFCTRR